MQVEGHAYEHTHHLSDDNDPTKLGGVSWFQTVPAGRLFEKKEKP